MLKYWLWLAELPGLTNQSRLALLRCFASPEELYYADPEEALRVHGITREEAEALKNKDLSAADRVLADCQRLGIRILTLQDAAYPGRLRNIYDPPCLLYWRGTLPVFDEEAAVAVVGTRSCTPYGIACAEKLGYGLGSGGALVVSGMARGIDAAALEGALRSGGAVAGLCGCGLDVCYPRENRRLYEDVAAVGALISEYPPGTAPLGRHFPARNRILAGLSVAALVVEAPARSGALITAELALEQGRDVFAVPGPIDAPASAGCNRLIREGAGLVSDAWDILREYQERFPAKLHLPEDRGERRVPVRREEPLPPARPALPVLDLRRGGRTLTGDQLALLRVLSEEEPAAVDDLVERTGIPARRVLSALTVLEMDALALQHSGKRYTRAVTLLEDTESTAP